MFNIKKEIQDQIQREIYPTLEFVNPSQSHVGQHSPGPISSLNEELAHQLEEQAILQQEIDEAEAAAIEREEKFRGETTAVRVKREEALETELERRLGEYGYQSDVARTRIGEQQSQRGMLRSTVAGRRLGDVALQEASVKAKGQYELQTELERGREEERRLFAKREDVKEMAKVSRMYAELDQSISIVTNLNTTIQQMKLQDQLAQEQISQSQTNAVIGAVGTVVATVAAVITYATCCFLFLEARYGNGVLDRVVRRYRDEMLTDRNRRGYYKLSEVLVPLMRKYWIVKFLVRFFMTDPLVSYGKYFYGEGKVGIIFKPIHNFWMAMFDYLGNDHAFIRENGEVV